MESNDNQVYMTLMAQYKRLRTSDPENAIKYLKGAMKLREQGNVEDDVVFGSAMM